jgi:hypothetical protein
VTSIVVKSNFIVLITTNHHGGLIHKIKQAESLNSQLEQYILRVSYWKNSSQQQGWVATALLEIEPNLRKIKGYKHLPLLRGAMERDDEKQILADVA